MRYADPHMLQGSLPICVSYLSQLSSFKLECGSGISQKQILDETETALLKP